MSGQAGLVRSVILDVKFIHGDVLLIPDVRVMEQRTNKTKIGDKNY